MTKIIIIIIVMFASYYRTAVFFLIQMHQCHGGGAAIFVMVWNAAASRYIFQITCPCDIFNYECLQHSFQM